MVIISIRFFGQIPNQKTDRLYSLLPLSQTKIFVARFLFPILFWLTFAIILTLLQMILYPIFTMKNTIQILFSLNGLFFIICSFFLVIRDLIFCFSQKIRILGIPNNLFPSIFFGLFYSIVVLVPLLTDITFGSEYFKQQRSDWLLFFFATKGAFAVNFLGCILMAFSLFIFKKRLTYLE